MKIGIYTITEGENYGNRLQNYALQKTLEKRGYDVRTILDKKYKYNTFFKLKNTIKKITGINDSRFAKRCRTFNKFNNEYIKFAKTKINSGEILKNINEYDCFIAGSDQIWNYNLSGNDRYYLGAFIKDTRKLNSYAASFGTYRSDSEEYAKLLNRFENVSIREESGLKFFEKITGRLDAKMVVDPVFLLTKDEWERLACRQNKKGYIFLYTLQGKATQMMKVAQYLSKNTGLPIVEMQAWFRPKPGNVEPRFWDDPIDFLSWIKNADFVVTDSFHCTAFSIIFQKKFGVRIEECEKQKNSRVGNLLYSLKLESQIVPNDMVTWDYKHTPNFKVAEIELREAIQNSKEFLNQIVDKEIKK